MIDGFLLAEYSHLGESESPNHDPFHTAPSYDLLNLRLGFQFNDYDASVTLWGRNVLDEEYRGTGFDPVGVNGQVLATPGEPATYGITLRKSF